MLFWIVIVFVGLFGAIADIALSQWSKGLLPAWWLTSSALFLLFMTGFGLAMRLGEARGYSLSAVVLVVLLANIAGVAIWDILFAGSRLTHTQWTGMALGVIAIVCFEWGRG